LGRKWRCLKRRKRSARFSGKLLIVRFHPFMCGRFLFLGSPLDNCPKA
jgi:hypothetical protein